MNQKKLLLEEVIEDLKQLAGRKYINSRIAEGLIAQATADRLEHKIGKITKILSKEKASEQAVNDALINRIKNM